MSVDDLIEKRKAIVRYNGKQIALFATHDGFYACNNRCPHQGYPLVEGSVDQNCVLTCNWHNWKFDLVDGRNLYGGDKLRTYPVKVEEGTLYLDVAEAPFETRYETALINFHSAVQDNSYDRIARELSRIQNMGGRLDTAVRNSISWSHTHFEYGWTHAYAGIADWLQLAEDYRNEPEIQLICHLEAIGHVADDIYLRREFPYPEDVETYSSGDFLDAVEQQNESKAMALLNGALSSGLHFADLEHDLARAALRHYNDFGHTLIYLSKIRSLIERLGWEVEAPLLRSYVRGLIYTTREDLIPEFRKYGEAISSWKNGTVEKSRLQLDDFCSKGINGALDTTVGASRHAPERLFDVLLAVNASHMLNFDLRFQDHTNLQISDNASWLSFTHSITFANAVRKMCSKFPDLWSAGLLQLACFAGRNHRYTREQGAMASWSVKNRDAFYGDSVEGLFDHGCEEFIVSVHLLKTLLAAREEGVVASDATNELVVAAMNRFVNSPLKRKHVRRTARQAIQFVTEGE